MYRKYFRMLVALLLLAAAGVLVGVRRILVDDDLVLSPMECELSLATVQVSSVFVLGLSVVAFAVLMAVRNDPHLRSLWSELAHMAAALIGLAAITVIDVIVHDGLDCTTYENQSAHTVHDIAGIALIAVGGYVCYKIVKIFRKTGVI